jgi:hypothetical protein
MFEASEFRSLQKPNAAPCEKLFAFAGSDCFVFRPIPQGNVIRTLLLAGFYETTEL